MLCRTFEDCISGHPRRTFQPVPNRRHTTEVLVRDCILQFEKLFIQLIQEVDRNLKEFNVILGETAVNRTRIFDGRPGGIRGYFCGAETLAFPSWLSRVYRCQRRSLSPCKDGTLRTAEQAG